MRIPAVIEVPETVTLDAFDLKASFTYSIRNPREGAKSVTVRVEQSGYIPDWLDGSETANCYIVTEPGVYGFRAVKGNTSESVGTIASVEVLWESFGSDVAPKAGVLIENAVFYRPSTSAIGRILSIMTKVVEWCSMILVVVIIGLRVILKVIQGLTLKAVHLALPSICLELRIIPVKRFMFIWKMKEKQTLVHYVNE